MTTTNDAKEDQGKTKIELELDQAVAEQLSVMEAFTKIPKGKLANTALKRFIAAHKDYFPADYFSPR